MEPHTHTHTKAESIILWTSKYNPKVQISKQHGIGIKTET
jgi:DNA-binding CsgD family transcriptional regulator